MDWQGRIVATPDTLFGKPRIAGTRIGVDFVPHIKPDDLQAVFAFASTD